jgi:hypothetical protein
MSTKAPTSRIVLASRTVDAAKAKKPGNPVALTTTSPHCFQDLAIDQPLDVDRYMS